MSEKILIDEDELLKLQTRLKKLAMDKSYFQLIMRLMNKMSAVPGLDNVIESMLMNVLNILGGKNLILYYQVDSDLHYADVYGERHTIKKIDDQLVQQVFDSLSPLEVEHDFSDTQLLTPAFTKAYTWVYPLLVGKDLIGVLKMESLHINMRSLYEKLPPFFTFAALVLKNEILSYSHMKQAYEQLELEMVVREQAESALKIAKQDLEQQVVARTVELQNSNQQLQTELIEHQHTEVELRLSEQKYRSLIHNLQVAVVVHGADSKIQVSNLMSCKILGLSEDEMLGKKRVDPSWHFFREDGSVMSLQEYPVNLVMATQQPLRDYLVGVHRPGITEDAWVMVNADPVLDEKGELSQVIVSFFDISENRQRAQEVATLKSYLQNILDSMPSIVVGIDVKGVVTHWNSKAESRTGVNATKALGCLAHEVFPLPQDLEALLRESIHKQQPVHIEHKLFGEGDESRFFDVMIYPLGSATVPGVVLRLDDVTERVRMEEMMMQSEKMMSVGGLAAGMAHEINNPLAGIVQGMQNLQRRLAADMPKNRQVAASCGVDLDKFSRYMEQRNIGSFIDAVTDAGIRASQIVENMLTFSRKPEVMMAQEDLAALMDKALELAAIDYDLKKRFDFRNIKLIREYDQTLAGTACVASEIQQVILNLLRNAAQAMYGYNCPENPAQILMRVKARGEWAVLEIEDNGPGMDEETRRRVFEPFFTTKQVGQGTGLGLSVSYYIICDEHNGQMEVESTLGKGATFRVLLPLSTPKCSTITGQIS